MIIINDKKELKRNIKLKYVEEIRKKAWVMEFDDDLTIQNGAEFCGENKYTKVLIANNITFKEDSFVPCIIAKGNIVCEKLLDADFVKAKNITAPHIKGNSIFCDCIKAGKISTFDLLWVNKEIDCDLLLCNKFECLGKINIREFWSDSNIYLRNLTADNTHSFT